MLVIKKLGLRGFEILKWQVPLGLAVAWAWASFAPRPECDTDVEKPYGCVWSTHLGYSGFFMQDVWIAGLSVVAGLIAGRFLHKKLREWGLLWQMFAALTSIGIMYLAIKYDMSINDTLDRNQTLGTGVGLLIARSNTALYLWAFVTQAWVVLGSGAHQKSEPDEEDDSDFLLTTL